MNFLIKNPNFFRLWLANAISNFGDKFNDLAIPIFVFALTGSALHLGLAATIQLITGLAVGLVAGALSDRWNQKRTLISADLLRMILFLWLAFLALLPLDLNIKLILVYITAFLSSSVDQFFTPAKVSIIPELVSEDDLMEANTLEQSVTTFTMFLGYMVAGAAIHFLGVPTAFLLNALTFFCSALLLFSINVKLDDKQSEEKENLSLIADIKNGLRTTWQHPLLKLTVSISLLTPIAIGAMFPLWLVYSHRVLGAGDIGLSWLEAAAAMGLFIGVLFFGKFAKNLRRDKLLMYCALGIGITNFVTYASVFYLDFRFDFSSSILVMVACLGIFLTAFVQSGIYLGIRVLVQENTPKEYIGRVFTVITVAASTAMSLGAATAGLVEVFGVMEVLVFWSLFQIVIGISAIILHNPPIEKPVTSTLSDTVVGN